MKKNIGIALAALIVAGCGNGGTDAGATNAAAAVATDQYFTFAIDGEAKSIPIKDVFASVGYGDVFKVFAGADRQLSVTLTIPDIIHCPCTVAAGSVDATSEIGQGSVSLQHYPNPGNGLNSWYVGQPGLPAGDAIRITDIGSVVDGARYITGEFHTTVLKTQSNGDGPENRDYVISDGKFRLRLETTGAEGW